MPEEKSSSSWWATLPGIITALAGLLTAVGGVILALGQAHFFDKTPQAEVRTTDTPAAQGPEKSKGPGQKQSGASKSGSGTAAASITSPGQPGDRESEQDHGSETSPSQSATNPPGIHSAAEIGKMAGERGIHTVRIRDMVLEYSQVDGSAVMKGRNGAVLKTYPPGGFAPGWTHIVWTPHGTLFYNSKTGVGSVVRFDDAGNGNTIKTYPSPGSPSFAKGWTSITLTAGGLVFSNATTGATVMGEIDSQGNFRSR